MISAGGSHTCAVLTGGTIECWGDNSTGELGTGTAIGPDTCPVGYCSVTPVAVSGINNAVAVAAGDSFTCAVRATGGIDCWGDNGDGELGTGTTTGPDCAGNCSATPVPVSGITNATAIATGGANGEQACALLSGGTIKCWGYNGLGQPGMGRTPAPTAAAIAARPQSRSAGSATRRQ